MDYDVTNAEADAAAPDLQRYLPEIASEFVSEEEAIEYLRTLWHIMCAFVDLGWGVGSIHYALPELAKLSSSDSPAAVSSDEHRTIRHEAQTAFAAPSRLEDSWIQKR